MKSSKMAAVLLLMLMVLAGCGGSGGGSGSPGTTIGGPPAAGNNVMSVTVNGSLCSGNPSYPNEPCVSVTICAPGTTNCQTIGDILLDTGSSGLRIFNQALAVPLAQVTAGPGLLAECVNFGDGSSMWGPVQMARVILGNEPAVQIPVQVVNQNFGTPSNLCTSPNSTPNTSPSEANYNGILGVGLFAQDSGLYFSCSGAASGSSCAATAVPNASQLINPVAALPGDNNGVIVQLPGVPANGAGSATGSLILGIGTQSNNVPSAVTTYGANQFAEFSTTFNGLRYASFLDTGSNGLFFPSTSATQLPACPSPNAAWFCPPATVSFSATNTGAGGSPSGIVSFLIGNAVSHFTTSNQVFGDLGGGAANSFDWGLPFFLGRSVFVGIDGASSSLGTGPYWAY
ncbi:DUF3443 family protein [Oryzomonas sagensis]|uniref:DUF3443 family protein n=1 Tax=Oryzomonas sagensis TaxID=2603857 RepID=A0ABQ6TQL5_9BACT|nr:DUF3443 family protein [Oryzomonas sagensis]KAB0671227.1 DUF3443 family protein [Oryzomonas sagensis]